MAQSTSIFYASFEIARLTTALPRPAYGLCTPGSQDLASMITTQVLEGMFMNSMTSIPNL